ncbi:MAG: PstS family phosphate ABC transporter substrate-binding protein [Alphaproteobacteria bacterium]|nr:PstS family phosphate ABC transporter substrate-binding protein [Alphaproteobacteria bacterium]
MTLRTFGKAAAIAASALAIFGFSSAAHAQASRGVFTIISDGSSTVYPITEAAAGGYQASMGGRVRVTVGESGTGGGFRKFCRGETDVQNASRPITASEMAACATSGVQYVEVPIAFDALSVVVNPANPLKEISLADLRKIWQPQAQGRLTNWKQLGPNYPDLPLTLYGPGTASGTFDYFTEAVVGVAKSSRTDYTPSEDDNILVQGVAGDKGALGYFGMAYYEQNKTKVRALAVNAGQGPVYPTADAVKAGKYVPLARPVFIYVNVASLKKKPVADFVTHYLTNASTYVTKTGYVPLPANAYAVYQQRVTKREAGTAFGGKADIGASIEEVLGRKLVKTVQQ